MSLPGLQPQHFEDIGVQQLQNFVTALFKIIGDNPMIEGNHLKSISLTTSATAIEHKLGKDITGYLVTSKSAAANISDNLAAATDKANFLNLTASANCVVDVWVF